MDAAGARPFTGGNAESLAGAAALPGSGAGNALCAKLCPAWAITTATVSGAIKRRMIKAVSPARSIGPDTRLLNRRAIPLALFTIPAAP